jgi:hypothetical protein
MSVRVSGFLVRNEVGVLHACFGIDFQAARQTPVGEGVRVDISLDGDMTLALLALDALLDHVPPFDEGSGQNMPVAEQAATAVIGLGVGIPDHADISDGRLIHGVSFSVEGECGNHILSACETPPVLAPERQGVL